MKPHRFYTLFRNLTFASFPALLTLFCGGHGMFFVVAFSSFVAAAVLAFVFPVRQDEPLEGSAKVFFGFFGGAGLLVMFGFLLVIGIACVDAVTSGSVEMESATYSELAGQRIARALHVDVMIPPEASKIRFTGFGGGLLMGWGRHAEFSCTTTESDFLRFASAHGYDLETNRFVNANATCNPNRVSSEWNASMWAGKPEPKHYLTFENIRGNGGGIRLVFDLDTGILSGRYSSN